VRVAEKQFGLTRSALKPAIYRTKGEHADHYTINVVFIIYLIFLFLPCISKEIYPPPQKKYHNPKSNRKIVETEVKKDIPVTHDRSLS
jgi:hypothetical protein